MPKKIIISLLLIAIVALVQHFTETKTSTPPSVLESELYTVSTIIDGDTIRITKDSQEETVRLLGIDTPETDPTYNRVECFGAEATAETKAKLLGKNIRIETDASQATRDKYNRLLAYIFIDGENFNEYLVRNGFAKEYTYAGVYRYQKEFQEAETKAKTNKYGLWSPQNCPTQK